MAGSLAVVMAESDAEAELIETAGAFSECRDTELSVLRLASPESYESIAETMETIGEVEGTSYGDEQIREGITGNTADLVTDALGETTLSPEVTLRIVEDDERADAILEVARENDCDHVFLVGQRRSPTGKALFGDITQKVILNFDGEITLSME